MDIKNRNIVSFHDEIGQNHYLSYHLLKKQLIFDDKIITYGISITKFNDMNEMIEFSEIYDISVDKQKIVNLLYDLIDHIVTPVSLKDIVEDFIA